LRTRRGDARWLAQLAIERLPATAAGSDLAVVQDDLELSLETAIQRRYTNPVVVWILLKIFVPILVRLVIDWWTHRKE
jgi:hypothetical protein